MPEWQPWTLGAYHPNECGGHSYRHSPVQATDQHRKAEKSFYATGKWQVAHAHELFQRCVSDCQVFGTEVPAVG